MISMTLEYTFIFMSKVSRLFITITPTICMIQDLPFRTYAFVVFVIDLITRTAESSLIFFSFNATAFMLFRFEFFYSKAFTFIFFTAVSISGHLVFFINTSAFTMNPCLSLFRTERFTDPMFFVHFVSFSTFQTLNK